MSLDFAETSYGIVKRLRVVEAWAHALAQQLGKERLSILDVGCGTGDHVTFPLASRYHDVLGVDFHAPSIEEASKRYTLPNLHFRCTELESLIRENQTFDLIVCSEVLEHVQQPEQFLIRLIRLVRSHGAVILTTPNGYGSYEMLCRLQRALQAVGIHQLIRGGLRFWHPAKPAGKKPDCLGEHIGFLNIDSGHIQFFRLSVLERLFDQAGFDIRERRARTLLCGPYVDVLLHLPPFRQRLYEMNNRLADLLPFSCAADWMFLLQPRPTSGL
jgi:SAM-dependent methyltransferase